MESQNVQQIFEQAAQHHQSGRLREAETLYRNVLFRSPQHVLATHNLGALYHQIGHNDIAEQMLRKSIALDPKLVGGHCNLGDTLRDLGKLDEAIACYREAIRLKPDLAEAHGNLGVALKAKGQLDEAIACYRQTIVLKPNSAEAYSNLGNALREKGRLESAADAHRRAIALRPNLPEAHYNFGIVLKEQGRADEAVAEYRRAIALEPNYSDAHSELANELRTAGQLDAAVAAYQQALALRPNHAPTHGNYGLTLEDQGKLDEAIAEYRKAIALQSDLAESHSTLGMALLLRGDWQEGWPEYEWRLKIRDTPPRDRGFSQPRWDASDLNGRALLLYHEQGFGDTIQFIRYLPLIPRTSGRVLIEVPKTLIPLLRQVPGADQWIAKGEKLPAFDVQCPLLSLPRIFGTTLQTIPPQKEPLRADPELEQAWQKRVQEQGPGLKVGLVWAGSPKHKNDHYRSIPLAAFAPLSAISGVQFYSLQIGEPGSQLARPPEGMKIIDWSWELHDFADTAALIANLDLVITVDTAVAHLAASMGKPIWILVTFIPDWRWLLGREDSPWYPSVRLFRQPAIGDWPSVIARVADALGQLAAQKATC